MSQFNENLTRSKDDLQTFVDMMETIVALPVDQEIHPDDAKKTMDVSHYKTNSES